MNARQELVTTGRLGLAGAELLYATVRAVAIARRFPPPEGHATWDDDGIQSTAHDFLQGSRGAKRLLDIALKSTDDASFRRLLERAVHNHLRDLARATDFGKLVIRTKELLRSAPEFVAVDAPDGERWTMRGGSDRPSDALPSDLASATVLVEVVVPRWNSATRDAPLADRKSMIRLITAVLSTANGAVLPTDIAHAVSARLDHRRAPLTVELDPGGGQAELRVVDAGPEATTLSWLVATQVFNSLSDRERIIVAMLDHNVRDLGQVLKMGKSQAALVRQRLIDRVAAELRDDDEPELTARALTDLCDDWITHRTGPTSATS